MHILVIVNDSRVPAGHVGEQMALRGATCDTRYPAVGFAAGGTPGNGRVPTDITGYDGLLILGGCMDAVDDENFPYFQPLMRLICAFNAAERPVLGLCLGAQLIARAYGAPVPRMGWTERGYVPLTRTRASEGDPLLHGLPDSFSLLNWHQDTFDLPPGATLLLTGENCRNQAFRLGESCYGFQPHFEASTDILRGWTYRAREDLTNEDPSFFAAIEDQIACFYGEARRMGEMLANRWLDMVEATAVIRRED